MSRDDDGQRRIFSVLFVYFVDKILKIETGKKARRKQPLLQSISLQTVISSL